MASLSRTTRTKLRVIVVAMGIWLGVFAGVSLWPKFPAGNCPDTPPDTAYVCRVAFGQDFEKAAKRRNMLIAVEVGIVLAGISLFWLLSEKPVRRFAVTGDIGQTRGRGAGGAYARPTRRATQPAPSPARPPTRAPRASQPIAPVGSAGTRAEDVTAPSAAVAPDPSPLPPVETNPHASNSGLRHPPSAPPAVTPSPATSGVRLGARSPSSAVPPPASAARPPESVGPSERESRSNQKPDRKSERRRKKERKRSLKAEKRRLKEAQAAAREAANKKP